MFEFTITSAIRGFHVYKAIWENPVTGDHLHCRREVGNSYDPLSVAVIKQIEGEDTIVGHVPRRISALSNAFIRRGGTILCIIDGSRRYSADLPKGGLEVPCTLRFLISELEFCKKSETMVSAALLNTSFCVITSTAKSQESEAAEIQTGVQREVMVVKKEPAVAEQLMPTSSKTLDASSSQPMDTMESSIVVDGVVCSPPKKRQKKFDEEKIIMGEKLTDLEIDFAQRILKAQFPQINGLQSTLLQAKPHITAGQVNENKIQIIFCNNREHWIVATTVSANIGEVKVYDSVFSYLDKESLRTVMNLFSTGSIKPKVRLSPSQKQKGLNDCGVFAICYAVAIALGLNPSKLRLQQEQLRAHLVNCFNKEMFAPFPTL